MCMEINASPKAISYKKVKVTVYLTNIKNLKQKIDLSRFRLSNYVTF